MKNPNNAIMMCGLYASTIVIIFFLRKTITNEKVKIFISLIGLVFTLYMLLRYGKDARIMLQYYLFTKK
ncbi:hypothetical protein LGX07_00710 [Streptococcus mutans]|uniref:hypothetical protein n=2 Tax=Streptococcus mutans TaxID=1309 RepID=UPI00036E61E5|nr:hypothetical protein [Streptococcus mutans]MCB4953652.1 hypothetical protein [Streptococcus mutans]